MRVTLAVLALVVAIGLLGQIVSVISFRLAQKLGLQEKDEAADPLSHSLELNTARWDLFVLWTLPVAAVLMLIEHSWWPYAALLAGGICVDSSGREVAKGLGLRTQGVRTGSASEVRLALGYFTLMMITGLGLIVYSLRVLTA